jgi:hypothetical protein
VQVLGAVGTNLVWLGELSFLLRWKIQNLFSKIYCAYRWQMILIYREFSQSLCNQDVVSFQTSVATSGSGDMPTYLDCSTGMDAGVGMLPTPSVVVSTGSSNMPADSGQNLKYGGPLAADWTQVELEILKDGMEK